VRLALAGRPSGRQVVLDDHPRTVDALCAKRMGRPRSSWSAPTRSRNPRVEGARRDPEAGAARVAARHRLPRARRLDSPSSKGSRHRSASSSSTSRSRRRSARCVEKGERGEGPGGRRAAGRRRDHEPSASTDQSPRLNGIYYMVPALTSTSNRPRRPHATLAHEKEARERRQ